MRRGDSKRTALARLVLINCFRHKFIQLTGLGIGSDLLVPQLGVKFHEPLAKFFQLFGGKLLNTFFKFLKFAHLCISRDTVFGILRLRVLVG